MGSNPGLKDQISSRLVAPVTLGMWIRYRWTKAAAIMAKIIIPVTLITVIFIFTVSASRCFGVTQWAQHGPFFLFPRKDIKEEKGPI